MTVNQLLADTLQGNLELLKMTLADFTDAEMFVRPAPTANHATWQLGHLINSENMMMSACGAKMPPLPSGFSEKFSAKSTSIDDPANFLPKATLLEILGQNRAATVAFASSASAANLEQAAPEDMRRFAPTVGHLLQMAPAHVAMHVGQIQVIRRKLGKPILF